MGIRNYVDEQSDSEFIMTRSCVCLFLFAFVFLTDDIAFLFLTNLRSFWAPRPGTQYAYVGESLVGANNCIFVRVNLWRFAWLEVPPIFWSWARFARLGGKA